MEKRREKEKRKKKKEGAGSGVQSVGFWQHPHQNKRKGTRGTRTLSECLIFYKPKDISKSLTQCLNGGV